MTSLATATLASQWTIGMSWPYWTGNDSTIEDEVEVEVEADLEADLEAEAEDDLETAARQRATAKEVNAIAMSIADTCYGIQSNANAVASRAQRNDAVALAVSAYNCADDVTDSANSLRHNALVGLAGYICGNRALHAGVQFLTGIKDRSRIKARDLLEVYLGWHDGQDSKGAYIRKRRRLYQIEKDVISINAESATELNAPTKRERAIAWQHLCSKRPHKNEDVKITNALPDDPARSEIDKLRKLVKGIANRERKRGASASSVKLGLMIDALCQTGLDLEEPILSYEDRKVFATSANFNGKPRTPKQ